MAGQVKILITISENDVAPRFDLTTEVLMATIIGEGRVLEERTIVLPHASAEDLCHLILAEGVEAVVCGGIEEQFYQYLTWKKILVLDSVIGPWPRALEMFRTKKLTAGMILFERQGEWADAG